MSHDHETMNAISIKEHSAILKGWPFYTGFNVFK